MGDTHEVRRRIQAAAGHSTGGSGIGSMAQLLDAAQQWHWSGIKVLQGSADIDLG
jgi:hypothetical protein